MSLGNIALAVTLLVVYLAFTLWEAVASRRRPWLRPFRITANLAILFVALHVLLLVIGSRVDLRLARWVRTGAIFFLCYLAIRVADSFIFEYLPGGRRTGRVPKLLRDIVRWVAAYVLLLIVLRPLGINLTPLIATSAAVTFILGFALQDVLSNLFAGIALNVEHPFSIGDYVSVEGKDGRVDNVTWRATRILTYNNEYLSVPNSLVAKGAFLNYSQPPLPKGRSFFVSIGYDVRPNLVKAEIREALSAIPDVLDDPQPRVWLVEFGESAIVYRVKFWVRRFEDGYDADDKVKSLVWYRLNRASITIPYPRRTVQIVTEETVSARRSYQGERTRRLLRSVPLFAELAAESVAALAEESAAVFYAAGEPLVRQNDPGDSLFIVQHGAVDISVRADDGRETDLTRLGPGDFFGEMSLLTGAPRSATVKAAQDTLVIVIRKEDVRPLLHQNPGMAEMLSHAMEQRQKENLERIAATRPVTEDERHEASFTSILRRVKGFFGLG